MFIKVFPLAVPLSAQVVDGSMDYFITSLSLTSRPASFMSAPLVYRYKIFATKITLIISLTFQG